jgi:2-polyprenyl-6-methoxyphenol hydroxylase-like FAD-dependent oxidoreductase
VEQIRATSDLPHRFRTAAGPGWALAGDAGLVMDPSTGQGLGNALLDAESLAGAVTDGLGGREPLDAALAAYGQRRDTDRLPMHEMTAGLASFAPQPGTDALFRGLAASPEATRRFFGVLGGLESPADFFTPENLAGLLA